IDEFWRGHAALALELNFDKLQARACAAANKQARSLDCDLSGCQLSCMLHGLSAVHLQHLTPKNRERPRPGLKSAQAVEQIVGGASEGHAAVFFFQNWRERGLRMVLRSRANLASRKSAQGLDHQLRADGGQLRAQRL